ncbi:MAG TPA: hypothetical protein VHG10_05805, partial [Glycomyces sp.]|nr:hypothetical protein [Glycomyces sp.]
MDLTEPRPIEPPSSLREHRAFDEPALKARTEVTEPYGYFTDLAAAHLLYEGEIRPAYTLADPTPLEVWRRNLEIVTAILTAAGVDCFAVPGFSLTRPVLAADAADRQRILTALAMLCESTGGRLSVPEPAFRESELGLDRPQWARRADMADVPMVRASWLWSDAGRDLVFGAEYGCDVEFWTDTGDGRLLAPRHNRISPVVRQGGARGRRPGR